MFAIKSRFKDRTMFIDIQFPLSQSVHLIVPGREMYGYALFVLYLHAGTSCLKGVAILIKHMLCCLVVSSFYGYYMVAAVL